MFRTSNTCLWYIFNDVVVWPFGKVLFYNRGEILHFCMRNIVVQSIANQQHGSKTTLNTVCPLDNEFASENRMKDTRLSVYSSFSNLFNWLICRHKDFKFTYQGQNGFYASYLTKDAKNEKTCYLHVFNLVNFQFDFVWPFESNRRNIVKLTAKDNKIFWVQSQWPLQAMIKTKSDRNKLKVSIFFLDSSNWNIDENHETMMTMRNDLFIVCLRKTSSGQFTKREITNW